MRFKSIPVEVEAEQFDGFDDHLDPGANLPRPLLELFGHVEWKATNLSKIIHIAGDHRAVEFHQMGRMKQRLTEGDWLVKLPNGTLIVMPDDKFKEQYRQDHRYDQHTILAREAEPPTKDDLDGRVFSSTEAQRRYGASPTDEWWAMYRKAQPGDQFIHFKQSWREGVALVRGDQVVDFLVGEVKT